MKRKYDGTLKAFLGSFLVFLLALEIGVLLLWTCANAGESLFVVDPEFQKAYEAAKAQEPFEIIYHDKTRMLEVKGKTFHLRIYEDGTVERNEWRKLYEPPCFGWNCNDGRIIIRPFGSQYDSGR